MWPAALNSPDVNTVTSMPDACNIRAMLVLEVITPTDPTTDDGVATISSDATDASKKAPPVICEYVKAWVLIPVVSSVKRCVHFEHRGLTPPGESIRSM